MSESRGLQWFVVAVLWVGLLTFDGSQHRPPKADFSDHIAVANQESLREALVVAREMDLTLDTQQANLALSQLLSLDSTVADAEHRAWFRDRLGALLARSGEGSLPVLLSGLDILSRWAQPQALTDEPRPWDPLDLFALVTADPVPGLLAKIASGTAASRQGAVGALGRMGTRAAPAIPVLEKLSGDPDPSLAALASDSLALIRGH